MYALKKKWSQNGSILEPFWKTAPLIISGAVFSIIIMFEKTVPKWGLSCGHENGSTLELLRLHFFLSVSAKLGT